MVVTALFLATMYPLYRNNPLPKQFAGLFEATGVNLLGRFFCDENELYFVG